jgi:hypothetical protein
MAEQIAAFDKRRLKSRAETWSHDDICAVERASCVELGITPP